MVSSKYTADLLEEAHRLRAEGMTWAEVADELGVATARLRVNYADYFSDKDDDGLRRLKASFRSQASARRARADTKEALKASVLLEDVQLQLADWAKSKPKVSLPKKTKSKGKKMTVEALVSDIQIGKLSPDYDLETAKARIAAYTSSLLFKLEQHKALGYVPERIVLALLGDIIESTEKAAKKGEYGSTACSDAEQVAYAIEWLYDLLLVPLAKLGIPMDIVCVTGNHDHGGKGMIAFKAGRQHYSWVIYKQLAALCKASGLKHLNFSIQSGVFDVVDIYGHTVVYEHGYGLAASRNALAGRCADRARQLRKHITYFRMGDKHNISRFEEDTLVVNGAFFGSTTADRGEEYSTGIGYSSSAGQIVFFHVPRQDERLPIYDSFIIQLQHVRG